MRLCSAALVYNENNRTFLLTSNKKKTIFLLPKGGLEAGLSPMQNAQKECREETGFNCAAEGFSLGVYEMYKNGVVNRVEVFALAGDGDVYGSGEDRVTKWLSPEAALDVIDPYLAPFVVKLRDHLDACAVHEARKK